MAAEPSNPEVFLIAAFLSRYGHLWDESRDLIRVARQLDPLTAHYLDSEASLELCADRPAAAVGLYRQMLALDPGNPSARDGLVRALAREGRFDEALDSWRSAASTIAMPEVAAALADAHGRSGYFALKRLEARLLLADTSRANAKPGFRMRGSLRPMLLNFQSGDTTAGFANLAAAVKEREPWIYRLPCMMQLDKVRELPPVRQMLAQIGAMPQR